MVTPYALLKASIDPVVFLLVLIVVGFWVSFKRKEKSSGSIILLITFLFLYTASISPVSNLLCYFLEKDYLIKNNDVEKLDVVVVLGGGISGNQYLEQTLPSQKTSSRLLSAVQVFIKSNADYLICAGKGNGKLSEGEVMGKVAEWLGVPYDRIRIDSVSENTWEHAEELNKMFQEKGIRIGIVTSAYHMKRSEREFRKYFSHVIPLPSDYLYSTSQQPVKMFVPRSGNLYKLTEVVNEMIGIAWYKLKG